jgi:hypothetical protein
VSRGPVSFKQRDVAAAIRAVVQAGREVERIEIHKDGSIVMVLANGKERHLGKPECCNEWDSILK